MDISTCTENPQYPDYAARIGRMKGDWLTMLRLRYRKVVLRAGGDLDRRGLPIGGMQFLAVGRPAARGIRVPCSAHSLQQPSPGVSRSPGSRLYGSCVPGVGGDANLDYGLVVGTDGRLTYPRPLSFTTGTNSRRGCSTTSIVSSTTVPRPVKSPRRSLPISDVIRAARCI